MVSSRNMKTTPAVACLKTLLIIFTIVFTIIGGGLLGVGIYSKVQLGVYLKLSTMNYTSAPWIMIGVGLFIFFIGIAGCCATSKGNTCLLRTYAICLGVIFLAELVGAIAVIIFKGKINDSFDQGMLVAMKNYKNDTEYQEAIDKAQTDLHCCGSANASSYWTDAGWELNTVPYSCCKSGVDCSAFKTDLILDLTNQNQTAVIDTQGCPSLVFGLINNNLAIIIGSMFGVAAFQLIGIVLACCLASSINANKYELV